MILNFEKEKLDEILVNLYNIAKVRTVIYNDAFEKIASYPEKSCMFCEMVKSYNETKTLCKKNDKEACTLCRDSDKIYIYKCHMGLVEAVAPIKMNDITIGYIMFGQILKTGENKGVIWKNACERLGESGELEKAFEGLRVMSRKEIKSVANIMEMCTCYLWIKNLIGIDKGAKIYRVYDYINKNLSSDISVEILCTEFNMGRTILYKTFKKYYGVSIAKYIRKRRIEEAAKYLRENNSSVSDAAAFMGFDDYNYFSKIFKSEMGVSPSEYKKRTDEAK